jgi:hypothetical protein
MSNGICTITVRYKKNVDDDGGTIEMNGIPHSSINSNQVIGRHQLNDGSDESLIQLRHRGSQDLRGLSETVSHFVIDTPWAQIGQGLCHQPHVMRIFINLNSEELNEHINQENF